MLIFGTDCPEGFVSRSRSGTLTTVNITTRFLTLSILVVIGCQSARDDVEPYPNRPIKLVVPFAPGGSSDTFARVIQRAIEEHHLLPRPIVIINRGGAGGTIGSRFVKDSEPDGYTILLLHDAILSAREAGKVEFGPEAFEPIIGTGEDSEVIVVRDDSRFSTLPALLEAATHEPETITFAVNFGAPSHVTARRLERASTGSRFRFVQSGGGADRLSALLGGHVEVSLFSVGEFVRFQPAGLRALAVMDAERHPALPEVPTARESDIDVTSGIMHYWWAPRGTPSEHCTILAEAIRAAMETPRVQDALRATHTTPTVLDARPMSQRLRLAERQMRSLGRPQADFLKWYPPTILGVTIVLAGIVLLRSLRMYTVNRMIPGRMVAGFVVVTIGYVGLLTSEVIGFRWATMVFVLAAGLTLAGTNRSSLLTVTTLALLLGPGLDTVMRTLVDVDLP